MVTHNVQRFAGLGQAPFLSPRPTGVDKYEWAQRVVALIVIVACAYLCLADSRSLTVVLTDKNGSWLATYNWKDRVAEVKIDKELKLPAQAGVELRIESASQSYEAGIPGTIPSVLVRPGDASVIRIRTGDPCESQLVSEELCGGQLGGLPNLSLAVVPLEVFLDGLDDL